jgi:membrane-bound metal-dependent hydrolase YbcI (DUF457 family)
MSTEFEQVADVEWEMNLQEFYFNITDNMTAFFDFTRTNLAVLGYSNTTEQVNFITLKTLLPIVNAVIKTELNKPFKDGPTPIGGLLEKHHLGVLNLEKMVTWAEEKYLLFAVTPTYRRYNRPLDLNASLSSLLESFMAELRTRFVDDFSN